jgi:hypothetical protein
MFCAPRLVFGCTVGVGSRCSCFKRPDSFLPVPSASDLVFKFCATGLVFGTTKGVRSRFQVLRARTHFRRNRVRRLPFSYFARPDSFSAVPRVSCPVSIFCVPGLVLGGTEGVRSRLHVFRSRTRFRLYRGRQVPFSYLHARTRFRRYRGRRVPFSCFALPDSFSAVPRATGPVFMYCAH